MDTNSLTLTKISFTLTFTRDTCLPPFFGNTIRGALGQSLYDNYRNVYDAVFKVAECESIPNPFTIGAAFPSQGDYCAGETLVFDVTLFGSACGYDHEIVQAAQKIGKGKLSSATLTEAECEYSCSWSDSGAETIPSCDILTLDFVTPTEILISKQPTYEPSFATFIDSLFGRIAGVIDNYSDGTFMLPYSLVARKPHICAEYDLTRININSNGHPISGFTGRIKYSGDVTRYLPYIDLGSQLHIGKKTTRSCGEYRFTVHQ